MILPAYKRIITKPSGTAQEKKHLSTVLVADGHPSSFLQEVTKTRNPASKREKAEFNSTAVLPYIKGVSTTTRNTYRLQVRHHTKISAGQTKRSRRPTQARWRSLQDTMRMRQVYIGETGRPIEERVKEHDRYVRLACTQNSAV